MITASEATGQISFWQDYLNTQFDPAHLLSELGFTVIFDVILIFLVWGKIVKPYIKAKLDQAHDELDAEHNVVDHNVQKTPRQPAARFDHTRHQPFPPEDKINAMH
jgi:hypothetical protein